MRALGAIAQVSLQTTVQLILLPLVVVELGRGLNPSRVIVASLVVCAAVTAASLLRAGPLRSVGLYVAMPDPMSIPFCILALELGGIVALAVLVAASGVFQIVAGLRLARLRSIINPDFSITLVLLACISLVPVFARIIESPEGARPGAVPVSMALTAAAIYTISRFGPSALQPWAPPLGLAAGTAAAAAYGIYDTGPVAEAAWIGLPTAGWIPSGGFDIAVVALLLPPFAILALVQVTRANTASLLAQFVSGRAVFDFREVQRANARIGTGSILASVSGTIPLGYSPAGPIAMAQSGSDPRRVGTAIISMLVAAAVCPKLQAVLMAVPRSLVVVYIVFVIFLLLRKLIPVSSIGQHGMPSSMWAPIATAVVFEAAAALLWDGTGFRAVNGLTAGSIVLVALSVLRLRRASRHRIDVPLASFSAEEIAEFVWSLPLEREDAKHRLAAVSEEALMVLIQSDVYSYDANRQMRLTVTLQGANVEAEFVAAPSGAQNLQERIMLLSEPEASDLEVVVERDAALRLLNHYATSVTHRQYQDVEIITAVVDSG